MTSSRLGSLFLFSLATLSCCRLSQAESSAVLLERLHHAAETTSIDSPGSLPFHLKMSIEIVPQYGRTADKGNIEMWWNSENEHRIDYDLSQYRATIVETPAGLFRTADAAGSPSIAEHMLAQVLHPISEKFKPSDFRIEATRQPYGKVTLDCIVLTVSSVKPVEPGGTSYCFDDKAQLRAKLVKPDQYDLRQTMGTLGTQSIPITLQYSFLNSLVASARINSLQNHKDPYPEASQTENLVPVPAPSATVPSQNLAGRLLRRPDPIYPEQAKDRHIAGTVLLHAIIGVDGKITHLSLIGSPDDSLTASAMQAVAKWVYQPYMVNGVPTEVDTEVQVHYSFGGN